MQRSSTSHNKVFYGGTLQPLVESLERSSHKTDGLLGQEVIVHDRSDIKAIIALDKQNDIHLLISPFSGDDPRFSRLDLRGLKVAGREWSVAGRPAQNYLDISCSTGSLSSFRRPFLKFAEDVLFETSRMQNGNLADSVYRTELRWKRFWSPDSLVGFTTEWLHGLFGELTFIIDMLKLSELNVLNSWTGPNGSDHDFQTRNELAVEIKTSTEIPFNINCNIRQLDHSIFKSLFIVCYKVSSSESGKTLPELVKKIEDSINDEFLLDKFYEKLVAAGYRRDLETAYNEVILENSPAAVFKVDDSFPKITEKSFAQIPDHRISNIRYAVKLTGVEELKLENVVSGLAILSEN